MKTGSIMGAYGGAVLLLAAFAGEAERYLRITPKGTAAECAFKVERGEAGWSIESVTGGLTVTARYDAADALLEAKAVQGKKSAAVEVDGAKVRVRREGQDAQEFEVPKGVIVTSAPDWTDTLLICRRYDRKKGGKQEFPGLWIHPVQAAQRLTLTAERAGEAAIEHGGRKVELLRLSVRLRGNSEYAAWVDAEGRMIKLAALPAKEGSAVLVREGYEASAAGLAP